MSNELVIALKAVEWEINEMVWQLKHASCPPHQRAKVIDMMRTAIRLLDAGGETPETPGHTASATSYPLPLPPTP